MTKPKTLEQLRAEKERAETQLAQEKHKLNRLENRKKYLEKGERQKRTHRLCNLGGTIESLAPEVKDLTRTEMTELMEYIFSLSEVQRAVRHMAIAPIPFATFGNHEQSHTGQNYLRSLFALGFQGFLIMICVGIYAVLIQNLSFSDNIISSIWGVMGYTVLLAFTLFKTGSLAKSVFAAH